MKLQPTMFSRIAKALQVCFASPRKMPAKQQDPVTSPVQLLISGKSTPASSAAYAIDQAVRSAADSDVLHAVDSAVGGVFYSAVYERVYIRTWSAVFATWLTKREIHFKHKAAVLGMIDRQLRARTRHFYRRT
jgi:glycerol dehydrogenase-like iron-containing ADH family enzyme